MGQYISFIHSFLRLFPDYLSKRMGRYLLHPFLYIYTSTSPGAGGTYLNPIAMARFIITTKHVKNTNGIRIEPGMSVQVVTQSMSNPVTTNGGQSSSTHSCASTASTSKKQAASTWWNSKLNNSNN